MTDLEILQLLVKAKELGVRESDVDAFKMRNSHKEVPDLKANEIIVPVSPFDDLSDDEALYWHSPYYDEIQTRKEAQKKKLAENINE